MKVRTTSLLPGIGCLAAAFLVSVVAVRGMQSITPKDLQSARFYGMFYVVTACVPGTIAGGLASAVAARRQDCNQTIMIGLTVAIATALLFAGVSTWLLIDFRNSVH